MPIKSNQPEYISHLIVSDHYILQHYAKNLIQTGKKLYKKYKTKNSMQNAIVGTDELSPLFDEAVDLINRNQTYLANCAKLLKPQQQAQFVDQYEINNRNTELDIIAIFQTWPDHKAQIIKMLTQYNQWYHIDKDNSDNSLDYLKKYIHVGLNCEKAFQDSFINKSFTNAK